MREAVKLGCLGPNQVKSFTRCGMGPCQGRECALTLAHVVAEARGVPVGEVGDLRVRPPLKPLSLGELARLAGTEDGRRSVRGADAIVIGGGLHGAVGRAAAGAPAASASLLLERSADGAHASGVNAGGVRTLGRDLAEIALSVAGMEPWHAIRALVDDDCGFHAYGQVKVAETAAELAKLEERAPVRGLASTTRR